MVTYISLRCLQCLSAVAERWKDQSKTEILLPAEEEPGWSAAREHSTLAQCVMGPPRPSVLSTVSGCSRGRRASRTHCVGKNSLHGWAQPACPQPSGWRYCSWHHTHTHTQLPSVVSSGLINQMSLVQSYYCQKNIRTDWSSDWNRREHRSVADPLPACWPRPQCH